MRGFLLLLCAGGLATALSGAASIAAARPAPAVPAPAGGSKGCLPGGNGYLRARIRGALNLDIDWHDPEIECEGGPRPDGSGPPSHSISGSCQSMSRFSAPRMRARR